MEVEQPPLSLIESARVPELSTYLEEILELLETKSAPRRRRCRLIFDGKEIRMVSKHLSDILLNSQTVINLESLRKEPDFDAAELLQPYSGFILAESNSACMRQEETQ